MTDTMERRALTRDLAKAVVVARHERRMRRLDWRIERDIGQYANGLPTRLRRRPSSARVRASLARSLSAHPARTLRLKARKRERVRCSSLVDWPVYPRLRGTMQGSERARNSRPLPATTARGVTAIRRASGNWTSWDASPRAARAKTNRSHWISQGAAAHARDAPSLCAEADRLRA